VLYLAAVGAVPLAWLGMHKFSLSAVGQGDGWPQTYTTTDFVGIIAVCVLGPFALTSFIIVAGNVAAARRTVRPAIRMMLALAHTAAFSALAILTYQWGGYDMLQCGVIGCVDGIVDTEVSNFGNGWIPWMGTSCVILFATLAVVCALLTAAPVAEMYHARLAARSCAPLTGTGNGATVAMLSGTAREDEALPPAHSLDEVRAAAKVTKSVRRLAIGAFFGLVFPTIWCAAAVVRPRASSARWRLTTA
jgi:hypothetical protein